MAFVIKEGNAVATSDNEQVNESVSSKYEKGTFIFDCGNEYSHKDLQAMVQKVSKSLSLIYEPMHGFALTHSGNVKERTYKRAITVLKKNVKGIRFWVV